MANAFLVAKVNDLVKDLHHPDTMSAALLELATMGMTAALLEETKVDEILSIFIPFPALGPVARAIVKEWREDVKADSVSTTGDSPNSESSKRKSVETELSAPAAKKARVEENEETKMFSSRKGYTRPYSGLTKDDSPSPSTSTGNSTPTVSSASKKTNKINEKEKFKSITEKINGRRTAREQSKRKTIELINDSKSSSRSSRSLSSPTNTAMKKTRQSTKDKSAKPNGRR